MSAIDHNDTRQLQQQRLLILDDPTGPSLNSPISYTAFISDAPHISVAIISSVGALSEQDKRLARVYAEVPDPPRNAAVEKLALQWHTTPGLGPFTAVYTKQEDLILRAAHLRELLGLGAADAPSEINVRGLNPPSARAFRDKFVMKTLASQLGVPVPPFARVYTPSCVLAFIRAHGLPVIIKPVLGSASAGVSVLRSPADVNTYLDGFFKGLDDSGIRIDYSGDLIIEKFVPKTMYHCNGYACCGRLDTTHFWPFRYISTNLAFTAGDAYGNLSVPTCDSLHGVLREVTQRVLDALPCPDHLVFHLELFGPDPADAPAPAPADFSLCEIAARRPGGSIAGLINSLITDPTAPAAPSAFHALEFRLQLGLSSPAECVARLPPDTVVGDLMVPHRVGTLVALPAKGDLPEDMRRRGIEYFPLGKPGTSYKGFSVHTMNTCARFVVRSDTGSSDEAEKALQDAHRWFSDNAVVKPLEENKMRSDVLISSRGDIQKAAL